jgi:hypothetical protein
MGNYKSEGDVEIINYPMKKDDIFFVGYLFGGFYRA